MPLFELDGHRFVPTGRTRGPWDPGAMNGGPVAALLAHGAETHDGGGAARTDDQVVCRLTVDLVRPVPLAPLEIRTEAVKPGRKVQVLQVLLLAGDDVVSRCVAVRMPAAHPSIELPVPPSPVGPAGLTPRDLPGSAQDLEFFHSHAVEMRYGAREDGRLSIWVRLTTELLPGVAASPTARVAAIADLPSGLSGMQSDGWRSINADITVSVNRLAESEWLHLSASSHAWHGIGWAETRLSDERGRLGSVLQTCLVEPWQRPGSAS